MLLASPANRFALFLGRTLPALVNGIAVSAFCFLVGATLLRFHLPLSTLPRLTVTVAACSFSCTALGLCVGAIGLRGRNVSVIADMLTGLLLLAAGANVPLGRLPGWVRSVSAGIPLTHGIHAARDIIGGASLSGVSRPLGLELLIGIAYLTIGIALLRLFEHAGRRSASLDAF